MGVAFAVDSPTEVGVPWYAAALLLLAVPPAAHLKWRHRGYWLGEDHLLTRNGVWSRSVKAVPYYRMQNVIDRRSLFQRRWNVATVVADTAGTSSLVGDDAAAVDIDTDDAVTLCDALTSRLQASLDDRRPQQPTFEWVDAEVVSSESVPESSDTVPESSSDEPEPTANGTVSGSGENPGDNDSSTDSSEPDDSSTDAASDDSTAGLGSNASERDRE